MAAIDRPHDESGAAVFFRSPALIRDLILPVEVGMGGGPTKSKTATQPLQSVSGSTDLTSPENFETGGEDKSSALQLKVSLSVARTCAVGVGCGCRGG